MCVWGKELPVDDQCRLCFSLRAEVCQWLLPLPPLRLQVVKTTTTMKVLPLELWF